MLGSTRHPPRTRILPPCPPMSMSPFFFALSPPTLALGPLHLGLTTTHHHHFADLLVVSTSSYQLHSTVHSTPPTRMPPTRNKYNNIWYPRVGSRTTFAERWWPWWDY
ncbi:hypothetical protein B0J11DRAFT_535292 [Dendryphion nanum]|uniref:Uncharacterized protein n=1 Tax=Dendryphion nanum TaxID=256645 RepID=A0A9P9DHL0_9PLEO|nr:hypothetical protein B0J11DRAFT_535292 [Dendryphion nanum]